MLNWKIPANNAGVTGCHGCNEGSVCLLWAESSRMTSCSVQITVWTKTLLYGVPFWQESTPPEPERAAIVTCHGLCHGQGSKEYQLKRTIFLHQPYFFINTFSSVIGVPRWGSLYHEWPVVPFSNASNVWKRRSSRFRCTILTRIHTTRSKGCSIFHVTVRNTTFVSCHVRRTKEYQLKKNPSTLSAPWFCLQRHWFSLYSHHRWSSCCSASYSPRPSPCYLCVFGWEGYNSTSNKTKFGPSQAVDTV